MSKIGLITLFSRNYGSALQCYATKRYIENLGYECTVMYQSFEGNEKYKTYLKKGISLIFNSIKYSNYYKGFMESRRAGKYSINSLAKGSEKLLDLFVDSVIQPYPCTYKLLVEFADSDDYLAFITGSDQVWSANRPYDPVMFLSFAPERKRIAFAASFGCEVVPSYNKKKFAKALKKIPRISVREFSGADIVTELTGEKPLRLSDPTTLLSPEEWREFSKNGCKRENKYIFMHFLDAPKAEAIELAGKLSDEQNCSIITFAYPHEEYGKLKNKEFVDGDPRDYLSLIDNAEYVVTDSFHTAQFSIYFEKNFYAFERRYRHSASQSGRLVSLMKLYNIEDRYIDTEGIDKINYQKKLSIDLNIFNSEQEKCRAFLENNIKALDTGKGKTVKIPDLKAESCTGCGVCSLVCPQKAIGFEPNFFGYSVPHVDRDKCIECKMCESICKKEIFNEFIEADKCLIAFSNNKELERKAASGGVFAEFAKKIISDGGIAFGARLYFDSGHAVIKHVGIENEEELPYILRSKYVQSNCCEAFIRIKQELDTDRMVLFGGTSCQVDALYRYLGKTFSNLLTIDLICHGVPGQKFFDDYIQYLQKKYHGIIKDFSFRDKCDGTVPYKETIIFENGRKICIPWDRSSYYRLFLTGESYRDSCYGCKFASLSKPADITIGDYFEAAEDYPELFCGENSIQNKTEGISCVLLRTKQGKRFFDEIKDAFVIYAADAVKCQISHPQLRHPSHYSIFRKRFFALYAKSGHGAILRSCRIRDICLSIFKKIILLFERITHK